MVGIGTVLEIPSGMVAGAVISDAILEINFLHYQILQLSSYDGWWELFKHIRYMTYATIPSILITLLFSCYKFTIFTSGNTETNELLLAIEEKFTINNGYSWSS